MKKLIILAGFILFAFPVLAQVSHTALNDNKKTGAALTAADWQGDLRFLQHTVHKDYPFLFKNITAKEFDASVDQLHKNIPAMQPHEVMMGFGRIVSSFKYGHTDISWWDSPVQFHMVPLNLYWFSNGLYVEGADKTNADLVGAKIVKVEGMPVEQALQAVKPLAPAENEQYFKAHGLIFLTVPEALHAQKVAGQLKQSISYTFEKNGKTFEKTVNAREAFRLPKRYGFINHGGDWVSVRDQSVTPAYLKNLDKIYYFEYLPQSKTVYVRHSQIQDDPAENIPAFYKRVFDFVDKNEVEKLVLDVRLNGGGNNYKNKPIVTGIVESKKINQPGKFFVIIGRRTFSACQNLVNELSNYTNAIFVGEPTSENVNFYGDNRRVVLPNSGLPVFLSFAWWQDKPQWENDQWLAPQYAIDMSFEDYKTNRDPVLEACLGFKDNDLVIDPMAHLKDLFMARKIDEVEAAAKKMTADPRYRYINFETRLNQSGYDLLNSNQLEGALYVFGLNTRLYPKSANVWDSYAEAHWKANKIDKAIEYYNKAIAMDPDGATGANARSMLQQIKTEHKK